MELRRQSHCVFRCLYHLVWIPKYRYKVLVKGVDKYLEIKLREVIKFHPEITIEELSIQPDHVHMVVSFPPRYSISRVVQIFKQNTGKQIRDKFDFIKDRYRGMNTIWSRGYFVSTVGATEEVIRNYVRYQEKEDSGQTQLRLGLKTRKPRT